MVITLVILNHKKYPTQLHRENGKNIYQFAHKRKTLLFE